MKRRLAIGRQLETRPNTLARLFVNRWRGQRRISVFLTKNVRRLAQKFPQNLNMQNYTQIQFKKINLSELKLKRN